MRKLELRIYRKFITNYGIAFNLSSLIYLSLDVVYCLWELILVVSEMSNSLTKCKFCDQKDEMHFILRCSKYNKERQSLLQVYLYDLVCDYRFIGL